MVLHVISQNITYKLGRVSMTVSQTIFKAAVLSGFMEKLSSELWWEVRAHAMF